MSDHENIAERILLLEDNPVVRRLVETALSRDGYEVWPTASFQDAMTMISSRGLPHLAVVDINLSSKKTGLDFCKRIQKMADLPIIILSSEADEGIVANAIDLHAEDYVIKSAASPLRLRELSSRIRRVLNRFGNYGYAMSKTIVVDDSLQVDFPARSVTVKSQEVKLTPTESKILHVLMRHAGRTVNADYLLRRLWPMDAATEERLHSHIYRLRRKVEPNPNEPRYVISDWGAGYLFPSPIGQVATAV